MDPFVLGSVAVAAVFGVAAAGLGGFLVATTKASRAPHPEIEEVERRFLARLQAEREEDRRFFAKALEEAASIEETVKRHRARIDGAKGGRPPEAPPQRTWDQLSDDEKRQEIVRRARLKSAS